VHACGNAYGCDGKGLPDLIIASTKGVIFAELKQHSMSVVKPEQTTWAHTLRASGQHYRRWTIADWESRRVHADLERLGGKTGCTHGDETMGDGVTRCYACNPSLVLHLTVTMDLLNACWDGRDDFPNIRTMHELARGLGYAGTKDEFVAGLRKLENQGAIEIAEADQTFGPTESGRTRPGNRQMKRRLSVEDQTGRHLYRTCYVDLSDIPNADAANPLMMVIEEQCDRGQWHESNRAPLAAWNDDDYATYLSRMREMNYRNSAKSGATE